jgi:hypothetical protein
MQAKNLADLYDLPTLEWSAVAERLDAGFTQAPDTGGPNRHTCWLATIDEDGKPHVTGIGADWHEGTWSISTGLTSRKGRNLVRDPRCTLSVALHDFDLVVEGTAELVTDASVVADYAARAAADGWPARPDETGTAITADFSAPSAGPPPWHLFRITARSAMVLSTVEPGGATRFTF